MTTVDAHECVRVAPDATGPNADVIVVGLAGSPARWLDRWTDAVAHAPAVATVVVAADADWRGGSPRARLDAAAPDETDVRVATVARPGNLTDLGVTLTQVLDFHGDRPGPTECCFQSLTVLLQYSPPDEVYRFLHALLGHCRVAGVASHFHLHAPAHDDAVVASLRPLFDRVRGDGREPHPSAEYPK